MCCDLSLLRLSYKMTEKNGEAHKSKYFSNIGKPISLKCHNRHKIPTKADHLRCNTSERQLGVSLMRPGQ